MQASCTIKDILSEESPKEDSVCLLAALIRQPFRTKAETGVGGADERPQCACSALAERSQDAQ